MCSRMTWFSVLICAWSGTENENHIRIAFFGFLHFLSQTLVLDSSGD